MAWLSNAFAEPPMATVPVILVTELLPIATLVSPSLVAPMPITTDLGVLVSVVLVALAAVSPQITLCVVVS